MERSLWRGAVSEYRVHFLSSRQDQGLCTSPSLFHPWYWPRLAPTRTFHTPGAAFTSRLRPLAPSTIFCCFVLALRCSILGPSRLDCRARAARATILLIWMALLVALTTRPGVGADIAGARPGGLLFPGLLTETGPSWICNVVH